MLFNKYLKELIIEVSTLLLTIVAFYIYGIFNQTFLAGALSLWLIPALYVTIIMFLMRWIALFIKKDIERENGFWEELATLLVATLICVAVIFLITLALNLLLISDLFGNFLYTTPKAITY
ncbi:MAG: hypothetical protein WCW02_02390 [Candidatus Buchananbacteria bacterium]